MKKIFAILVFLCSSSFAIGFSSNEILANCKNLLENRKYAYDDIRKSLLKIKTPLPLLTPKEKEWAIEISSRSIRETPLSEGTRRSMRKTEYLIYSQDQDIKSSARSLQNLYSHYKSRNNKEEINALLILIKDLDFKANRFYGYADSRALFEDNIYSKEVFEDSKSIGRKRFILYNILFVLINKCN